MIKKGVLFATCLALAIIALLLCIHFVRLNRLSSFYRGSENVKILSSPDRVELYETFGFHWKMTNGAAPRPRNYSKAAGAGRILPEEVARRLRGLLLNPLSYRTDLGAAKSALDTPEIILKFTRGNRKLELNVYLESASLEVMSDGMFQAQIHIGSMRDELARVLAPFLSIQPHL